MSKINKLTLIFVIFALIIEANKENHITLVRMLNFYYLVYFTKNEV